MTTLESCCYLCYLLFLFARINLSYPPRKVLSILFTTPVLGWTPYKWAFALLHLNPASESQSVSDSPTSRSWSVTTALHWPGFWANVLQTPNRLFWRPTIPKPHTSQHPVFDQQFVLISYVLKAQVCLT